MEMMKGEGAVSQSQSPRWYRRLSLASAGLATTVVLTVELHEPGLSEQEKVDFAVAEKEEALCSGRSLLFDHTRCRRFMCLWTRIPRRD